MTDRRQSVAVASLGGATNLAVVLTLYVSAGYPALTEPVELGVLTLTTLLVGVVLAGITAYTRLLTPAVSLATLLVGVGGLVVMSPQPTWHDLGGVIVVAGPTHAESYATAWPLWLALGCYLGALEYALRDRYDLGAGRLTNLPALAVSDRQVLGQLTAVAGALGFATGLVVFDSGGEVTVALVAAVLTGVTGLVALVGLVRRRLLGPAICAVGVLVPVLLVEVVWTPERPVHFYLLAPLVAVLVVVAGLEYAFRSRWTETASSTP